MTLESTEILELRLADGLASPDERAAAEAAGVDVEGAVALRRVVARALAAPPLTLPGEAAFADRVLAAAGLMDGDLGGAIRAALDAGPRPELADQVLAAVRQASAAPHAVDVEAAHRAAAGAAPDLAASVLGQTHPGAEDTGGPVRAALDAGPAPELADAVLGADTGATVVREALSGGAAPELGDAVVGPSELRPALRAALDAGTAPELADSILAASGARADGLGGMLREALDGGAAPDLMGGVFAELGIELSDAGIGDALVAGSGPTPNLGDAVMAAVGADTGESPLADAVAAQAGPTPDLWASIAAEIGAEPAESAGPEDMVSPAAASPAAEIIELAPRRRWWLPAAGVAAAAAAAVLAVVGLPTERVSDGHGALAAHIHLESGHAEIEEISAGPDAMVQVLQFEEDAPTIIFIDVLEEPDGSDGDEGVPL
jgi:hypothetical protein